MAKNPNDKDITNISAVISQMGIKNERLIQQFQEAISSSKKLDKTMTDLAKKGYANVNKAVRETDVEIAKYLKHIHDLSDEDMRRLEILQKQKQGYLQGASSLKAFTQEMGYASITSQAFAAAASAAETAVSMGLSLALQGLTMAYQALGSVVSYIISLYGNWNDIMQTTVQSMASLAMNTGATGDQLTQLQDTVGGLSDDFSNLGGSVLGISEATEFVTGMSTALRDTRLVSEELGQSMLTLNRAFGLSAEQSANLFRLLQSGSMGAHESINDFTIEMDVFAHSIGATTGQVLRDFSNASDYVARFGRDGVDAFRDAATQAQAFGFEARQIFEISSQFDTFSQASDNVNQLNAMLGTTISSFELMQEQDPARRVEMLRQAIMGSGTAWANMDQYQRRAIAQSLNLSEQEAARLFDENISLQQLQEEQRAAQAAEEARDARRESSEVQMADLLARTSTLWDTMERHIRQITNHLSTLLGPLFGEMNGETMDIVDNIDAWLTRMEKSGQAEAFVTRLTNGFIRIVDITERFINAWDRIESIVSAVNETIRAIGNTMTGGAFDFLDPLLRQAGAELTAPTGRAPTTGFGVGASADIRQAVEGQRRQVEARESAERDTTALSQRLGLIETRHREEIDRHSSTLEENISSLETPETAPARTALEARTSAARTSPRTDLTTARSTGGASPPVTVNIAPSSVILDSRQIGQVFWDRSAR